MTFEEEEKASETVVQMTMLWFMETPELMNNKTVLETVNKIVSALGMNVHVRDAAVRKVLERI